MRERPGAEAQPRGWLASARFEGPPALARRRLRLAIVGAAAFVVFTGLVASNLFVPVDRALLVAAQSFASKPLDVVLSAFSPIVGAETSVALAVVWAALLWRAGHRLAAVAPLLFLISVPIEFALKLNLPHPGVPHEFYRPGVGYPLLSVSTAHSYPSGHATRSFFFGALAWLQLTAVGGRVAWLARAGLLVLEAIMALNRVYLGVHWATDVAGGWLLGFSLAMLGGALLAGRDRSR